MTNKRTIKAGDLLVITKLNGEDVKPPKVVTALTTPNHADQLNFAPDIDGECTLDTVEFCDVWYFADEYELAPQKEYDDEALTPSYSAVATSLDDYTGVNITAESLSFESDSDKALATISPDSLAFKESQKDNVNHPDHYTTGKTEVIDILEDLASRYDNPVDAYLVATAAKYLFRSPFKGAQEQDIRKAVWYLTRLADNIADRNEE
ncbi:DUF3310 domain-containing protein [Macrococcus armenti]|uniref:DUF3310 domain-containing protein n=1 Tax=Macrococcus armenti TaxID=2875764 RepID=UPI001CCF06DC|nr:DUF3310 domain-containing protein [Macrococcus armenti]UBH21895.1 DUF3310 domain-containing protein [Macrococcus armenti]